MDAMRYDLTNVWKPIHLFGNNFNQCFIECMFNNQGKNSEIDGFN